MAPAPPARLAELAAALRTQLPVLVSFVLLRWLVCASAACACAPCVPARLRAMAAAARRHAMAAATLAAIAAVLVEPDPPTELCSDYAAQRAQGVVALLALAVLLCSNRPLASALALSALKGVSDLSSTSVPLAVMAAHGAFVKRGELITYFTFGVYTLLHAVQCHTDAQPERTHSTILATLVLCAHLSTVAWLACCCCPFRSLSRRSAARAPRHATHSPPASVAATPRPKRRSLLPVLRQRRDAPAASPPHIPPPRPSPRCSGTPSPARSDGVSVVGRPSSAADQ